MTNKVKVTDIYECKSIDLACELYYVCELGKYLYYNYSMPLSMKKIELDSVLTKSDIWLYFCIAIEKGWLVDISVPEEWLLDLNSLTTKEWKHYSMLLKNVLYTLDKVTFNSEDNLNRRRKDEWYENQQLYSRFRYDLMTPKLAQIAFSSLSSHNRWVFALEGKYSDRANVTINNSSVNGDLPQFCWLSLIAFVAIKRYMEYQTDLLSLSLYLSFNNTLLLNEMALSYFLILYDKSNCFNGWVFYTFDENIDEKRKSHIGYVAWYKVGLDKGLLSAKEWFETTEKIDLIKKLGIKLHDVVLLFERKDLQKFNHIKEIVDMKIAIVERVTNSAIYLHIINNRHLRHENKLTFEKLSPEIKKMYSVPPFQKLSSEVKKFDWFEIGVQYAMVDEKYFILPLDECEGDKIERVTNGYETLTVSLEQTDFIYWLLEDYSVNYNKVHFLKKYFKDRVPLYQSYVVEHNPMPSCYIRE